LIRMSSKVDFFAAARIDLFSGFAIGEADD
jgi:hypothetical protein